MFASILSPQLHIKTHLQLKAERLKPVHPKSPEVWVYCLFLYDCLGSWVWVLFVCLFNFLTKTQEYRRQFLTRHFQLNQHGSCKLVGSCRQVLTKPKEKFPTCWNKPELLRRVQTDHPGLVKKKKYNYKKLLHVQHLFS